jgi:hypothetical protein
MKEIQKLDVKVRQGICIILFCMMVSCQALASSKLSSCMCGIDILSSEIELYEIE